MGRVLRDVIVFILLAVIGYGVYQLFIKDMHEKNLLKQMIARLEADSRVAEVLVTGVNYNETEEKSYTTIKFLEYDSKGNPLEPKYYTFSGNIIQFQALVIRFDDIKMRRADQLKGKSAYLFWKVFMLDGKNTQEYEINRVNEVPDGYKLANVRDPYEEKLWQAFWGYALDPKQMKDSGIKNAQIEAPGTMFVPGNIYIIRIEHNGGLRIDVAPLSPILRGEKIP